MSSRRAMAALAVGAVLATMVAGPAMAAAPEGADGGDCPVLAAATGIQVTVNDSGNPAAPGDNGLGVPVAQSCVNYGIGESRGFASSPYPGDAVIKLMGQLLDRPEFPAPPPAYPAYVYAQYPGREQDESEQPGYELAALSAKTTSHASARTAAGKDADSGSTLSRAKTSVDPAARTSNAVALADIQPLVFGDVLHLGQVRSEATATLTKAGKVERSSQLRVGRTTVAGQEVVITPKGLEAAGQTVGVPGAEPADALRQAGISIRYLAAEKLGRGILSAGLEVTLRNENETGEVKTVRYVLGRALAVVAPVESFDGDSGNGGSPQVPAHSAPGGPVDAAASGPLHADDGVAEAGPVAETDVPEVAELPKATAAAAQEPVVAGPAALLGRPTDMGIAAAYLVIVFGAVTLFASGTLVRLLGVKTRWTS